MTKMDVARASRVIPALISNLPRRQSFRTLIRPWHALATATVLTFAVRLLALSPNHISV